MGSAQSLLSPEAAVTVAVVAGAVGFGYTQLSHGSSSPPTNTSAPGETAAKKGKKKKQGGKKAGGEASESTSAPTSKPEVHVVPFPEVIPGQFDAGTPVEASAPEAAALKAKKSKKKKGKAASTEAAAASPGTGANTPHGSPAGASSTVDYLSEASVKPAQASKSKNAKRPAAGSQQTPQEPSASTQAPAQTPSAPTPSTSSPQLTRPSHLSTTSLDTDGSWTRVGSRRRDATASSASAKSADEPTASDAGVAASNTGNSSPVAERAAVSTTEDESQPDSFLLHSSVRDRTGENRKTLAEKLLPKPRKTGVDDMLETSDYPTLARVMRVQPLPNEKPASGFSWADYEDVRVATDGGENDADGEDDGWGVVTSKRPKRTISTSQPSPGNVPHSPHTAKAPETLTKRQRQNADKRDAQKAAKADAEAERLAALAKHKRELEQVKMAEQEKERERERKKGKAVSGGMKAGVDEKGRLVWE